MVAGRIPPPEHEAAVGRVGRVNCARKGRLENQSPRSAMSSEFNTLSYRELQQACKSFGLDATGSREAMLERLQKYRADHPADDEDVDAGVSRRRRACTWRFPRLAFARRRRAHRAVSRLESRVVAIARLARAPRALRSRRARAARRWN
jgi:hypothetical protein